MPRTAMCPTVQASSPLSGSPISAIPISPISPKPSCKKSNDMVLSGFAMYARESRCWMTGVPTYVLNPAQPTFILQEPKKITMMWQMDQQVRHVYMDVPHSANPKPSWYGESVGHYEADTLVIDTIGLSDKTTADIYRTPHTDKMHVVERWRIVEGGSMMESVFTVDDPGTFYRPWTAMRRYRRVQQEPIEQICAENNMSNIFDYHVPTADKPDF